LTTFPCANFWEPTQKLFLSFTLSSLIFMPYDHQNNPTIHTTPLINLSYTWILLQILLHHHIVFYY
jgi:hypothetical protein